MARAKTATSTEITPADLIAAVTKQYGPGALGLATDVDYQVTRWSTGCLPIDHMLDGGIPKGRFIEVFGPYSTLKSYVLYRSLGAVQKQGGKVGLIDTEHSFDPDWATELGVDVSNLLISRPQTAEQAIGVLEAMIRQRYDLVGFDSIAAAIPQQHAEVAPGEDTQPGALARVMSKGLARLNTANKTTSVIFVNQTRNKIGQTFGSPITTSGGNAMGFYASYRMSFRRIDKVSEPYKQWNGDKYIDAKQVIAHRIQVTMEKSKLSAPHREAIFTYDLRTGLVDEVGYIVGLGLERGLVTRTDQGYWNIPDLLPKAIHGKAAWDQFLQDNPDVVDWIKAGVGL